MTLDYSNPVTKRSIIQTVTEQFQADSEEDINSTPEATGQKIRRMMARHNISVKAAANVLQKSPRYIRGKLKNGSVEGRESWEFLRFLPQRYNTMLALNDNDNWMKASERQEVKLIMVKHWSSRIPCVAIKYNPSSVSGLSVLASCKKHEDSTEIHFGTVDSTGHTVNGVPVLPVVSNRPSDHIRATGSFTMQLAHEYCVDNWNDLQCGDSIDVAPMASAQASRCVCRTDMLRNDSMIHTLSIAV